MDTRRTGMTRRGMLAAMATTATWNALGASDLPAWKPGRAKVGSLDMHYVEHGSGPAVLLCHGFPECWISWRHQIGALAAAGFRVIAPDLRGYGRTGGPKDVAAYGITSLVGDLVGLLDALNEPRGGVGGPRLRGRSDLARRPAFAGAFPRRRCTERAVPTTRFRTGSGRTAAEPGREQLQLHPLLPGSGHAGGRTGVRHPEIPAQHVLHGVLARPCQVPGRSIPADATSSHTL